MIFFNLFKKKPEWEYGVCNGKRARRHIKNRNVQFVLWKAGEQGHAEDFWINVGAGWENLFLPARPNYPGRNKFHFSISWQLKGLGFIIDTFPPYDMREKVFTVEIKLICIGFWWIRFKSTKPKSAKGNP